MNTGKEQKQEIVGKRRGVYYSEAFRREVIGAYLASDVNKCAIWKHYTGKEDDHGRILKWMRAFGINERPVKISDEREPAMNKHTDESLSEQVKRLTKELAAAERAREQAELKAQAFSILIDIAEKELQIPIRKKSVAKPSM